LVVGGKIAREAVVVILREDGAVVFVAGDGGEVEEIVDAELVVGAEDVAVGVVEGEEGEV
jgi:hypothetical protein